MNTPRHQIYSLVIIFCTLGIDSLAQVNVFFDRAVSSEKRDPSGAFELFCKSAEMSRGTNENLYLKSVVQAAGLANGMGDDSKKRAFNLLRQAVKKVDRKTHTDLTTATIFYQGGDWFRRIALKPDSSLWCFQNALEIRINLLGEGSEEVAACYFGMGDNYKYSLYDFDAAERNYEKALEIREGLNQRDEFQLARTYFNLATTNRSQGDFEKAIAYGLRAIQIVRKIEDDPFLEATYSILGNIYRDMGQYDSAQQLYQLAIKLNRKNYGGGQNENLAILYQGLGSVFKKAGRVEGAIESYNTGLKIYSGMEVKNKVIWIHCLQQLGEIHASRKEFQMALNLYRKALNIQGNFNLLKSGSASGLYNGIADVFLHENQLDSALYYSQKSLVSAVENFNSSRIEDNPDFQSIELKTFAYAALITKARALIKSFKSKKNPDYAKAGLRCYLLAERILVESRNSLDMEEAKWAYLDENFNLYEEGVKTTLELSSDPSLDSIQSAAFFYFEGSKSRSLADALQTAEFSNKAIFGDSLLRKRNNDKIRLFNLHDQLKKVKDDETVQKMRNSVVDIDRELKLIENEIKKRYPAYLDVKREYPSPSIAEVQNFMKQENALLLEYFWGKESVYIVAMTEDQVLFRKIGNVDALVDKVNALVNLFQQERSNMEAVFYQSFVKSSFDLYQTLIGPLGSLLSGKERIIIVPDGMISQVPFEVLITSSSKRETVNYKDLDYLVKTHIIDYAFSASFALRQSDPALSDPKLLAFGLTSEPPRSGEGIGEEGSGAALELASMERLFPAGSFYLGASATKQGFIEKAPEFDLIHLAIHGKGDTRNNYSSSLFFKNMRDGDGELHWYELYGVQLKAKLVVLSACESGIGKSYRGEGMLSMASAFAYSGCRNLLLGLWKVNDQVSVQLMDKFYEGIRQGTRVDEALTIAKRDYLTTADELSANPKMWGSLVAFGNLQVIEKKKGQWIYISIALIISLAGLTILFRKNSNTI